MYTTNIFRHLLWGALVLGASQAQGQATTLGNSGAPGEYLGWDAGTLQALEVRHDGNWPIEWYTDATRRMLLNQTQTGQNVNGYAGLDLSGNLGVGQFSTGGVSQPYTRLHLDNGGNGGGGFRPWMVTGTTTTRGSDLAYFGMKNEGMDRNHTVITWSDNTNVDGPDQLRFIFTSDNGFWGAGISGQLDGLEAARIHPAVSGDESFFGIGDWFNSGGQQPDERLDILDRTVRIRDLPTDYEDVNKTMDKVVVVDADGRLFWRPESDYINAAAADCDWYQQTTGNLNVSTAYPGAPTGCPDENSSVGIGVQVPASGNKFQVVRSTTGTAGNFKVVGSSGIEYGCLVRGAEWAVLLWGADNRDERNNP